MRQRLGQHFLCDPRVVQTILAAAELGPLDTALEIGPGKGILTEPLSARVARLVAVELDDRLAERLQGDGSLGPQVRVVHADFLQVDLDSLFPSALRPIKILGNLPYSITSPIFEKILSWPGWDIGVFLIQREVAQRIQSGPGSRTYGILSLAIQLFAEVETIHQVKPGAFVPAPKVSSTVIRLRRKTTPRLSPEAQAAFFDLIHGAFAHRRKTLANSLALHLSAPRENVAGWLSGRGISPAARAETIALADYARLAEAWSFFRREINLTC